jgi:hypothetical protein
MRKKFVIYKRFSKKKYYIASEHCQSTLKLLLGKGYYIRELDMSIWKENWHEMGHQI